MLFILLIASALAAQSFRRIVANPEGISSTVKVAGTANDLEITTVLEADPTGSEYWIGYGHEGTSEFTHGVVVQDDAFQINDDGDEWTASVSLDLYDAIASGATDLLASEANNGEPQVVDFNATLAFTTVGAVSVAPGDDAENAKLIVEIAGFDAAELRNKVDDAYTSTTMVQEGTDYTLTVPISSLFVEESPIEYGFIVDTTDGAEKASQMVKLSLAAGPSVEVSLLETGKLKLKTGTPVQDGNNLFVLNENKGINHTYTATEATSEFEMEFDGSGAEAALHTAYGEDGVPTTVLSPMQLDAAPSVTYALATGTDNVPSVIVTAADGVEEDDIVYLKAATTGEVGLPATEDTSVTIEFSMDNLVRAVEEDSLYMYKKDGDTISTSPVIVPAATTKLENGVSTDEEMTLVFTITAGSLVNEPQSLFIYATGDFDKEKNVFETLHWTTTAGRAEYTYKYADFDNTLTYKAVVLPTTTEPEDVPTVLASNVIDLSLSKPAEPEASFSVVASFFLALSAMCVLLF